MYEIKIQSDFSAAHNLRNYRGKCENLHGHNWKVEVKLSSRKLDKIGMVMDFTKLKEITKDIISDLDHKYLNEIAYFKKINPTSENIAKFIYGKIGKRNKNIAAVSVWENDTSCATYRNVIARAR